MSSHLYLIYFSSYYKTWFKTVKHVSGAIHGHWSGNKESIECLEILLVMVLAVYIFDFYPVAKTFVHSLAQVRGFFPILKAALWTSNYFWFK